FVCFPLFIGVLLLPPPAKTGQSLRRAGAFRLRFELGWRHRSGACLHLSSLLDWYVVGHLKPSLDCRNFHAGRLRLLNSRLQLALVLRCRYHLLDDLALLLNLNWQRHFRFRADGVGGPDWYLDSHIQVGKTSVDGEFIVEWGASVAHSRSEVQTNRCHAL